jgi:hypothetical protein
MTRMTQWIRAHSSHMSVQTCDDTSSTPSLWQLNCADCIKYPFSTRSMATRRRIGVSIASTEAARRQLMHPVPCWEKVWVTPSVGSSSLKVYKWVKTEKVQVGFDISRRRAKCLS